jgi:hypothetical protein
MKRAFIVAVLIASCFNHAHADGGRLRFSSPAGPFLVTLFTTPEPLTPGPADFSVMVQDAKSGEILPDAQVTFDLVSRDDPAAALHAAATHGIATNRLLQAAELDLPRNGMWTLHLNIRQGDRSAALDAPIIVDRGSRKSKFVWIFVSLPILAIILFVFHQRQKMYLSRRQFATTTRKI